MALAGVVDPEIPVLTIAELGILRGVEVADGRVTVSITPTYSGCPAIDVICTDIVAAVTLAGCDDVSVETVFDPAWTTDWMSDRAKDKLAGIGIAPPGAVAAAVVAPVLCPRCSSSETSTLSEFGSDPMQSSDAVPKLWRSRSTSSKPSEMTTLEFYELEISDVQRETDEAVSITFDVPASLTETFRYLPGQHVTVRAMIDGEDVRRSYSICSNANSGTLRIGIKRLGGGAFSTYATNDVTVGDRIDVMPPIGEFTITVDPGGVAPLLRHRRREWHHAGSLSGVDRVGF